MSPAAHSLPTLHAGNLTLRPPEPGDVAAITTLLQHPDVAAWWGENTEESVAEELVGAWVISVDGGPAGILECHEETEPDYPSVAFDIAINADLHGRGLGQRALALAIEHFHERGHHRFTIDPAAENVAAYRCYRAVGFQDVGILRAAERGPDGTWRDAVLMDLILWPGDPVPWATSNDLASLAPTLGAPREPRGPGRLRRGAAPALGQARFT